MRPTPRSPDTTGRIHGERPRGDIEAAAGLPGLAIRLHAIRRSGRSERVRLSLEVGRIVRRAMQGHAGGDKAIRDSLVIALA